MAQSVTPLKKIFICITILAFTFLSFPQKTFPDTDIALDSWVYETLEGLAMLGMTEVIGLYTRPISRMAAAKRVSRMIDKVQDEKLTFSVLRDQMAMNKAEDLLYRLMDEFEEELEELGVNVAIKEGKRQKLFLHRMFEKIDFEVVYGAFGNESTKSVNLENRRGWELEEEINGRIGFRSWAKLSDVLSVSAEPAFYGSKEKAKITLDEALVEASLWNIEVGAGRTSMWWGPGREGSLLLSSNTRPLYLAKAGNVSPFRLPYLENLGLWNINFFTAKLIDEEDREVKEPYFSGLKVEYSPHNRLNLAGTHTIMWGGEGVPNVSATDLLDMFVSKMGGGADEPENHIVSVACEWAVPYVNEFFPLGNGILLYAEVGGEDEASGLPIHLGGLGGIRIMDLVMIKDLDLVMEYAQTDEIWYTHHKYTDGYTSDNRILGHHMGGDSDDILINLTKKFGEQFEVGLRFDGERHGLSKSVTERKYEGGVDFKLHYTEKLILGISYEIEYFDQFRNVSNQTTKNHIFSLGGRMDF